MMQAHAMHLDEVWVDAGGLRHRVLPPAWTPQELLSLHTMDWGLGLVAEAWGWGHRGQASRATGAHRGAKTVFLAVSGFPRFPKLPNKSSPFVQF